MFTLSRTPLRDLRVATSDLNRLFDEAFQGWPAVGQWTPAVDIVEDKDGLRIAADLPGVKPEDVKISVENGVLGIRGEKQTGHEQHGDKAYRFERTWGSFERAFTLPETVDAERIEARYEHGVLTVTLPRAEKAKPRQIEVKVQA